MIRVIDDYAIDSDGSQYIVGRIGHAAAKKDKPAYDYIKNPTYHGSFSGALTAISRALRLNAIKNTSGGIKDACEAIRQCDARMIEVISQFDEITVCPRKDTKVEV